MRNSGRSFWQVLLTLGAILAVCSASLVATPALRFTGSALAQDATPGQEQYIDPTSPADDAPPITEEPPAEATLAPTEEPPIDATLAPTEEPATVVPLAPSETSESSHPSPAAQETEPDSEEASPPAPIITVSNQPHIGCWLSTGGLIHHGGSLEYECEARFELFAAQLPVLDTLIHWTVTADASGAWSVQLAPLDPDSTWSPIEAAHAVLGLNTPLHSEAGLDNWGSTESVQFRMRVHRPRCDVASQTVQLHSDVSVSPNGTEGIEIRYLQTEEEPVRIAPELAPIPVPSASFDGSITFEPVEVSAVDDTRAAGNARVHISGLDSACGDWLLLLQASSGRPEASLWLTAINGVQLGDACALETDCPIASVSGTAGSPAESIYELDVVMTIPSGVLPGTLRISFDIALVAA